MSGPRRTGIRGTVEGAAPMGPPDGGPGGAGSGRGAGSGERGARLGKEIKDIVTDLISREIRDPRVTGNGLVTVTDVQLSQDNGTATIYISVIGGKLSEVTEGLMQARGFLQKEIAKNLKMKRPPRVKIAAADTVVRAQKMEQLFAEIAKERAASRGTLPADAGGTQATRTAATPSESAAGDSGGHAPTGDVPSGDAGEKT
jgi:ribosome-binding factor A